MALREVVARNLRRLRRSKALSQEELADRAGINRNYVGMLEREENAATVDMLEKSQTCLRSILSSFSSVQCGQARARDSHLCVSFGCVTTVDFFRAVSISPRLSASCIAPQESAIFSPPNIRSRLERADRKIARSSIPTVGSDRHQQILSLLLVLAFAI
jgi:DNA-binding XRE family transcriptional regulator